MPFIRDFKLGRLFARVYRRRGPGYRFLVFKSGVSVWLGRLMFEAHWLHKPKCNCNDCVYERELQGE